MRVVFLAVAMLALAAGGAAAQSSFASFDCAKASKPDEQAICANNDLAQKDGQLGATYKSLLPLVHGEKRQKLVESQRKWLGKRARCETDVSCLEKLYAQRQKALDAMTKSSQAGASHALFRKTAKCNGCDLSGADLSGIQPAKTADNGLMQCNIEGRADGTFDGAHIDHSDFITCDTKYPSALSTMSWDGASLKGTDFTGSNLGGNSFKKADLTGANLSSTKLYWVDMSGATLKRANLNGAQSTPDAMNGICSQFPNADFSDANLEKAKLCGTFYNAEFSGANLRNATLFGNVAGLSSKDAKAQGNVETDPPADIPRSVTKGRFGGKIDLTGADLHGATLFSETKLTDGGYAFAILCRTTMPDGTTSNRDCK